MGKVSAFVVAKLLRFLTRLRGGGSAFPGLVLLRLRPQVLAETLGDLRLGRVFVSGSNGKSTTTTMITSLLRAHGLNVFSNPAGGNLPQGLASAVVGQASISGRGRLISLFSKSMRPTPSALPMPWNHPGWCSPTFRWIS